MRQSTVPFKDVLGPSTRLWPGRCRQGCRQDLSYPRAPPRTSDTVGVDFDLLPNLGPPESPFYRHGTTCHP